MRFSKLRAILLAAVAYGGTVGGALAQDGLSEAQVRAIVQEEIAKNPKIILDSLNAYMREQQTAEAAEAEQKVITKKAEIAELDGYPFIGNPDGSIEIVYFFDVNCGYCKRLDPSLKRIVAENPDIKLWHREIPILAESSQYAAYVAGLVWQRYPEHYEAYHDLLMGNRGTLSNEDVEAKLRQVVGGEIADEIMADVEDFDFDGDARVVNNRVQENLALSRSAGITGTPFVYVLQGDGIMRGAGDNAYEHLAAMVQKARSEGR